MSLAKTVESARAALTAGQKPHGWQWFSSSGLRIPGTGVQSSWFRRRVQGWQSRFQSSGLELRV